MKLEAIEQVAYEGWVYDATTSMGAFVCDGITVRNCGWSSHDDTDLANGSVRTLDEAEANPISHLRCARSMALLPVATRREAQRIAAGDYSDVRTVEPLAPRSSAHQRRLAQREARLQARAAKVRG